MRPGVYCFAWVMVMLFSVQQSSGQDSLPVIKGVVTNKDRQPLQLATVTVVDTGSTIISYALTNTAGNFTIPVPPLIEQQKFWLEASYIGYLKKRIQIERGRDTYELELVQDPYMLSEVVVRAKPVLQQFGDTLRYIVSSFAKSEDRSIGDVLRRMPGITVEDDGTIYHNGKKIENLYIHGDDLMSGRYGTATKVVRKEMIASVDVIQNHQPIKVLKDKVFSDKTSINLVLKNEHQIKWSGTGKLGLGIPSLYDISANAILLNKKFKGINTASVNNAGIDYSNNFKKLGGANMVQDIGSGMNAVELSLATTGNPAVPQEYYYLNKSALINLNNLYNLKNEWQVKLNIQGFTDKNSLNYKSHTQNFIGSDTISFLEAQSLKKKPAAINALFNVLSNRQKYFLNNTLQYSYSQNQNSGWMQFNNTAFNQLLYNKQYSVSNDFNWVPQINQKGVLEFRWLYNKSSYRNELLLLDSFYSNIISHQGWNDKISQQVKGPATQSNAFFSYKLIKKTASIDARAGWLYEKQLLFSDLYFINGNNAENYSGDSGNDLSWRKNNLYIRGSYDLRAVKWSGSIVLPLVLQSIGYTQNGYGVKDRKQTLLFNPDMNVRYEINPEKYFSFKYGYNNNFGNYTDVYRGAILLNYRALQANEAGLRQNKTQSASLTYNYGKSIKLFFFNAGTSYRNIQSNTIVASSISDHLEKTILLPLPNQQNTFTSNIGASKFLHALKMNASLNAFYSNSSMEQLINNNLVKLKSNSWATGLKLNKRFDSYLSIDYNGSGSRNFLSYNMAEKVVQKGFSVNHAFTVAMIAIKKVYIDFSLKNSYSKQSGNSPVRYFFADSKIRYTPRGNKLDCNLQITNLFNVKTFIIYNADTYRLNNDEYHLRGRMIMFRLDYFF